MANWSNIITSKFEYIYPEIGEHGISCIIHCQQGVRGGGGAGHAHYHAQAGQEGAGWFL
jgi:hypothetical protein